MGTARDNEGRTGKGGWQREVKPRCSRMSVAKDAEVQSLKQAGHGLKGTRRTEGTDVTGF